MKTTIELSEGLLAEAKRVARRDGTTLKALVEQGLRKAIDDRKARKSFTLKDASVDGKGLSAEAKDGGWEVIRDLAYGDRGA